MKLPQTPWALSTEKHLKGLQTTLDELDIADVKKRHSEFPPNEEMLAYIRHCLWFT